MSKAFAPSISILLCAVLAAPAWAQGSKVAAASAPSLGGPQVPGVCLLSQQTVLGAAKVGVAATERLRQLAQTAQGELDTERSAIEADAKALDGQKASLAAAQFEQRRQALLQRSQAYQAKVQERSRQVEATRVKVLGRIAADAQPVIAQVYQSRGCGLLFSRDVVLGGNMAGDLTSAVVQGLDAKVTTIDFNLEPPAAPLATR